MNTRKIMVLSHLALASLFLPMLFLMPMTGTLYLWGVQGEMQKDEAFRIQEMAPKASDAQYEFFREQFKKQNLDYSFEKIKASKDEFIFRPSSRVHYMAVQEGGELVFYKLTPSLLKRLTELHKGHGPSLMRWFESAFGVALVLVTLSGLWLSVTVPSYRKITFTSLAAGSFIVLICLI